MSETTKVRSCLCYHNQKNKWRRNEEWAQGTVLLRGKALQWLDLMLVKCSRCNLTIIKNLRVTTKKTEMGYILLLKCIRSYSQENTTSKPSKQVKNNFIK